MEGVRRRAIPPDLAEHLGATGAGGLVLLQHQNGGALTDDEAIALPIEWS